MIVIPIAEKYLAPFKAYCQEHRYEHDESYLYEEDMDDFELGTGKHPTYLLMDGEVIVGVLSLMLDDYFLAGQKARVRIFHCDDRNPADYKRLLDAVQPLGEDIHLIELFMPNRVESVQAIVKDLGFHHHRTSYVMVRKNTEKTFPQFPDGYELKPFVVTQDEVNYQHIRNTAFKTLKGSESPIGLETIKKLTTGDCLLTNGVQILWQGNEAVGLLRMELEEGPDGRFSFVAPIALLPGHQGKGLGTELLKAGIAIGQNNDLNDCMLSVNAENEQALGLYTKVGFTIDEAVSCFQMKL